MKREANTLTFIDLFAGVGGLTEGFCKAALSKSWGLQPLLLIDNDPDAISTFKKNRPFVPYLQGDISKIDEKIIRKNSLLNGGTDLDFLIGGPPCQGFSTLTSHRADRIINDPRNKLMKEFLRVAAILKPIFILIENVPSAASYAKGQFIAEVREELEKIGYSSNMQVVTAHDYGVPQLRRRLIILGVQNKYVSDIPLDFPTPKFQKLPFAKEIIEDAISGEDLSNILSPYLSVEGAIGDLPEIESGEESMVYDSPPFTDYQAARRKRSRFLCNHSARVHSELFLKKIEKIHEGMSNKDLPKNRRFDRGRELTYFSQAYGRLHRNGIAQTITANFLNPGSGRFLHYANNRSITVREAARFQSFDDDFVFYGRLDAQQRQVGNAVPPLLAKAFAEHFGERVLAVKRKNGYGK